MFFSHPLSFPSPLAPNFELEAEPPADDHVGSIQGAMDQAREAMIVVQGRGEGKLDVVVGGKE